MPGKGRPFAKGNKLGGRPKVPVEVREAAKALTMDALAHLERAVKSRDKPSSASVHAAEVILDRAWGKPTQPLSGPDGESLFAGADAALIGALVADAIRAREEGDKSK